MKTLIIGFEGYQGRSSNPAATVATALDGKTVGDMAVTGVTIPVIYAELRERVFDLLKRHEPGIAVGLGLWPGEPTIRLEQLAYNRADFEMPDNAGQLISGEPLAPGGAVALEATIPTERIVAELLRSGIPARTSQTAGTFLCNATLYALLSTPRAQGGATKCGFIHLPYLPAQVAALLHRIDQERTLGIYQRADLASMDPDTATEAVRIALRVAGDEVRGAT